MQRVSVSRLTRCRRAASLGRLSQGRYAWGERAALHVPHAASGVCYLVGAGPGSVDHLTVRLLPLPLWAAHATAYPSVAVHTPRPFLPGNLQLRAVELIKQADVIVYDDLGTKVCWWHVP